MQVHGRDAGIDRIRRTSFNVLAEPAHCPSTCRNW